ncbi:DUF4861 domain-containing protein [Nonlabens xiamenensis]|uniref:DUF4861 domain-containing protein n=1 Tax=Nonlabens xiamenensis TaxID=2341043 RepID=UPI000F60AD3D|nr:DUF4861 domain-containing protein [Nonlabens xiamenensis]
MNARAIFLGILAAVAISCEQEKEVPGIKMSNDLDTERTEIVVLSRDQVNSLLPDMKEDQVPVIKTQEGEILPFQLDDLDQDGNWDEMAVEVVLGKKETKEFFVHAFAKAEQPNFTKTTDVHFGVGKAKPKAMEVQNYERTTDPREQDSLFLQMEGPAWENDKLGFRMYFDPRNGIDIFGKTTAEPVLAKQGLTTNYHEKADWGMDVLKVGNSLGAGSVAIQYNDSIYRLKGTGTTTFKTITEGPVRAIFTMTYKDELIADKTIDVLHTISIEKSKWYSKNQVQLMGDKEGMALVTGIVNLKPNSAETLALENGSLVLSHGQQSENKDALGMAVIVPQSKIELSAAPSEGEGIINTHLVKLPAAVDNTYYFMAGWEASDNKFASMEGFRTEATTAAQQIFNPVQLD